VDLGEGDATEVDSRRVDLGEDYRGP